MLAKTPLPLPKRGPQEDNTIQLYNPLFTHAIFRSNKNTLKHERAKRMETMQRDCSNPAVQTKKDPSPIYPSNI